MVCKEESSSSETLESITYRIASLQHDPDAHCETCRRPGKHYVPPPARIIFDKVDVHTE